MASRPARWAASVAAALATVGLTACGSSAAPATSSTGPAAGGVHVAAAAAPADWPSYHVDAHRAGDYHSMPAFTRLSVRRSLSLDGPVYASPIVIGGTVVVATENNTVYAFDRNLRQVWKRHLGTPVRLSALPCGNIDPLGITGTPVYSSLTRQVYVAAELAGPTPAHRLFALNMATGGVTFSRSLDLPGVDARAMQERGALTIVGSRVYVPFGGLAGDCGSYKGRIVSWALSGGSVPTSYTVPTAREAGIWTPPGLTTDARGTILAAVGNGAAGTSGGSYDHSDSVLQLNPALQLTNSFSPSSWRADNDTDKDLGSQGPIMVGAYVFQAGKSGTAYVLRRSNLGGIGGQVSKATVCRSFGGTALHGTVVYVPCTDGLRAVQIDATGHMHVLWHAASSVTGSPVYGGGRVFSLDTGAGVLHALSTSTGATTQAVAVGATSRFATPAEYGRLVYVPTLRGLTVVSTS